MAFDYLKDPAAIYDQSFATIEAEADLARLPEDLRPVAVRLIHACGMTDLPDDLAWSDDAVIAGRYALTKGAAVLVDVEMVAHGVIKKRLNGNDVICTLNDPTVTAGTTTRTAAAVELWRPWLDGAVVAIGNAPTALFHLMEMIEAGAPKPAVILGFPVGFVGAVESKDALADFAPQHGIPFITVRGRRGGSAMAAAAVNALAGSGETP